MSMDDYEKHLREALLTHRVPVHMHDGYLRYILYGEPVGDFLTAVLSNDLMEAASRADDINRYHLFQHCTFLHCDAPAYPVRCHGSPEIVEAWIALGGMRGHVERLERTA